MILKDYIKQLQEIEEEHGGELEVVYSTDDEGNNFSPVHYSPSAGTMSDYGFDNDADEEDIDSVCIN